MRHLIPITIFVGALSLLAWAQNGPLTNGANLPVRTDANSYLIAAAQTYSGPDGPRRPLANTLVRTDANGYLIVTNPTGFGSPLDAQYWVGAANGTLTAEKNLGALSTGLVLNTAGVPSTYGGSICGAGDFVRALSASGVATCGTDGGGAPTDAEYWVATANGTLSAERNLGLLTTGLVLNTVTAAVGVPSTYAGTSCTNQFPRSLSASAAATCASVSLTADVTGTLGFANGGMGATAFTAGSVLFSNGTIVAQDNANFFWDDANNWLGLGIAPTSPLTFTGADSDTPRVRFDQDGGTADAAISTFTDASGTYMVFGSNAYVNASAAIVRFDGTKASSAIQYEPGSVQMWTGGTSADPTKAWEFTTAYLQAGEQTAPSAPSANRGRIFFQDDGAGKTQLCVLFSSGAAQCFATQP